MTPPIPFVIPPTSLVIPPTPLVISSAAPTVIPSAARNLLFNMLARSYYVYILSSKSRVTYVGVTNNLERRLYEHRAKIAEGFTKKYNVDRLVYFEETLDVTVAISREKQIKAWSRNKKIALIESANPTWEDLSAGWGKPDSPV